MISWYRYYSLLLLACLHIVGLIQALDDWHFTGTNIALKKPTYQHPGQLNDGTPSPTGVDGDVDTGFHTAGALRAPATWSVDLGGSYMIKGIYIYNNQATWAEYRYRLVNFTITGYPGETVLHDESTAQTKQYENRIMNFPIIDFTSYSNITITVPAHTTAADGGRSYCNLCEVMVYSVANYCPYPNTEQTMTWALQQGTGYVYTTYRRVASGSVIDFTCSANYKVTGAPSITCGDDGRYSADVPTCVEIRCDAPGPITNGGYTDSLKDTYAVGETIQWACSDGYKSGQVKTRECLVSAMWDGADPVCSLITCPHPGSFTHGMLRFTNGSVYQTGHVKSKTSVRVTCDEGYKSDVTTIMCKLDETWDKQPTCSQITCARLPNITDGSFTYRYDNKTVPGTSQTYIYGTVASVVCDEDFQATGAERRCGGTGIWSGDQQCERICSFPPSIDNGVYHQPHMTTYKVGETIQWGCSDGYKSDQARMRECLGTSSWSDADPMCTLITCSFPDSFGNGTLRFTNGSAYQTGNIRSNSSVHVNCNTGFKPGDSTVKCMQDERWDTWPVCLQITCDRIRGLQGGSYLYTHENETITETKQSYVYGSVATAVCQEGFKSNGSERVCVADGQWSGDHHCLALGAISQPQEGGGVPGAAIGGAVAGVVVVVAVVVLVIVVLRRRRPANKKTSEPHTANGPSLRFNNASDAYGPTKDVAQAAPTEEAVYEIPTEADAATAGDEGGTSDYVVFDRDKVPESAIRVNDLVDTVVMSDAASDRFSTEFEKFPSGMTKPHSKALENRARNRYRDLYAYDESRVVLTVWNAETDTDYFNASYIHGFDTPKAYIASQGPVEKTINDFWRMIWQVKTDRIVMLTGLYEKGKMKCDIYWPESGTLTYGGLNVTLKTTNKFSSFVVRDLLVEKSGESPRLVKQFHFTAWPDKDVPSFCSSLVYFRHKVKAEKSKSVGPTVVHCSAGIGRTGTYIAIDYLTDEGKALNYVDVFGCVMGLRGQRVDMVQKEKQYKLVHQALVEILVSKTSCVPTSAFVESYGKLTDPVIGGKRKIDEEFEIFWKLAPKTEKSKSKMSVKSSDKDRHLYIQPAEECMPSLSQPGPNLYDEYINAAFLPMYKDEHALIITQTPLASTVQDFWNMVYHQRVHTIVMMNSLTQIKPPEVYWPEVNATVTHGDIKVQNSKTEQKGTHNVIHLTATRAGVARQILLIQFGTWTVGNRLPDDPRHVLSALEIVEQNQRQSGNNPVVVHCMDGVERSGLFCVVAATLDRTKIEQEVAISQVIQELRSARPNVIPNMEQFVFCHEVVKTFLQQYETYSNFQFGE